MLRLLGLAFAVVAGTAMADDDTVWATATSRNGERAIIFRFVETLPTATQPATQPHRIIIQWKYSSDSGMPSQAEVKRMYELEDLLYPAVHEDGFATLALISTGENLREWIFYARS